MKIVFLAPFGIRPKGTLIARLLPLAKGLGAMGHEVIVVAPPYTNPEDSGKTEIVDGITIRNIILVNGNIIRTTLQNSRRMYQAALEESPDLVHLFKPKGYGGLAAMYLSQKNDTGINSLPLFVDTDDWEGHGGMNEIQSYSVAEKWLFDFQERWLPRKALGVTVASRELQNQVVSRGTPENRVLYLPNCVEPKKEGDGFRVRQKFGIDIHKPVVLLYTRFFEFSQERLYYILRLIVENCPDAIFMVVGKGRYGEEDQLVRASRGGGFEKNLIMVGWTEPEHISDYLAAADVAIYPLDDTLVNRSKCPAKLTEIMLAGCAVVADRVGQTSEYLEDGVSGLLVDPKQPDHMATAVLSLLNDKQQRTMFGEKARTSILNNFRWHDAAKNLSDFYQSCLTNK